MEKSKKLNCILSIAILFLSLTYIFSFVKANSKKVPKPVKSAIVNPKYQNTITNFILKQGDEATYLNKVNDLWFVSTQPDAATFIPADSQKVENFIKDLTKVINLYKISDKYKDISDFGLSYDQAFCINYDNNELFFGEYDFSKTKRYVMTGKNTNIYQISSELDKYLSTSIQLWSDPNIISTNIIKIKPEDFQRIEIQYAPEQIFKIIKPTDENFLEKASELLKLRHGGVSITESLGKPELSVLIHTGDASEIELKIFKTTSDAEYNIQCNYLLGLTKQKYSFEVKISQWTYNRIKEIIL